MRLPEIAAEIAEIGRATGNRRLVQLSAMMKRRRHKKPVPAKDRRAMTPQLRRAIRTYARNHPGMANCDIGTRFRVDGGRVSEVLYGKRT